MFKKLLPHIVAVVFFYFIGIIFFAPDFQGKQLIQTDIVSSRSASAEVTKYREETGITSYWNNGMFGGMPWWQLTVGKERNATKIFKETIYTIGQTRITGTLFFGMLITYLILFLLGVNPWLSIIGAFAFAYNTNYVILIEAGHLMKVDVLVVLPLILGGSLLAFRGKPILGAILFSLGCSMAIYHSHLQMLYYMVLLTVLFYAVYFLVAAIAEKQNLVGFLKPVGLLIAAALIALASGSAQLYATQMFSSDTMRGKPILEKPSEQQTGQTSSEVEGLEWNYVNQWSNDSKDLAATLIPRFVGGSSAEEVASDSPMGRLLQQNGAKKGSDNTYQAPGYWGSQPFTSGPSYLGALVLFLFVFAMFQVTPAMRWGMVAAVLIGVLISLGSNASWLVRPLYDYFPLFNKFRAHSSMLSVLPVFIIIGAFVGLQKAIDNPDKKQINRDLMISFGIVGGFCLLIGLIGNSLFSFLSPADASYPDNIKSVFIEQRQAFLRADAFRSFFIILIGAALIWLLNQGKVANKQVLFLGLGLLVVLDLFTVNRRYLDADNFMAQRNYDQLFAPRAVDNQIFELEPQGRGYYRVLDLSVNTFNDAATSYHHNTIGGYFAAKLQRIQDLIDYHISQNNSAVLNMLNTKYIINQRQQLQPNPGALGNAWFVSNVNYVDNPNQEIGALNDFDPSATAVILKADFEDQLAGFTAGDGTGSIEMTNYAPNRLVYQANTNTQQLAVFSEIWYGPNKGWTLRIDGEPAPILRANYTLRAAIIPAGNHELVFEYKQSLPSIYLILSSVISWLLVLGSLAFVGWKTYQWYQKVQAEPVAEVKPKKTTTKKAKLKKSAPKKGSKKK